MPIYRFVEPRLGRRFMHEWRVRAARVLVLLGLIIAFATAGLAVLDNSADPFAHKLLLGLWNAINLVTTLGDFSTFDVRQRLFMLGTMLGAMIIGAFAVSQLTGILSSSEVLAYRENRRMERTLQDISGHAVVAGYIGLGAALAQRLVAAGHAVVVIERDPTRAAQASSDGYLVIQAAEGVIDDVLETARIASAGALYVTTDDNHRNLALTLMARALSPGLRIVATVPDERAGHVLRRAGATDVVVANQVLANAMIGSSPT
jgi:voltage-gated potassium channel